MTLERLRRLIFGPKSEKTSDVLKGKVAKKRGLKAEQEQEKKKKAPGHGRNGVKAYPNAKKVKVLHPSLQPKDVCPACERGKLYPHTPGSLVRITGQAPIEATVYEMSKLRCNACGKTFQAPLPDDVEYTKYDASATSMVATFKYGTGVPFNRLANLQAGLGVPLPATTQWDMVKEGAGRVEPAYTELVRQAAQGEVIHNDDTSMKINALAAEREAAEPDGHERTGCFTTGVVSCSLEHTIALFFTGAKHAGENLEELLQQRAKELNPPIQMSDALSRNYPKELETIVANCNAHARRKFVEAADSFPEECKHLLDMLGDVYKNDAFTKQQEMDGEQRLAYHQANSKELMEGLKKWAKGLLTEKKVEPNSGLGQALTYMLKHWEKLTLFLKVPGAPLDNNICERALKKAIMHRKNSLFYKTALGAHVGDVFMSLIYSAELAKENPFHYLTALLRHSKEVADSPTLWMPWNYREVLATLENKTPLNHQPEEHPPP